MKIHSKKRHTRWYERLFFSTTTISLLGTFLTVLLPAVFLWGYDIWTQNTRSNTIIVASLAFISTIITLRILVRYPGNKPTSFIGSILCSWYFIIASILIIFGLEYSSLLLIISFTLSLFLLFTGYFLSRRWLRPKIAFISLGRKVNIDEISNIEWIELTEPKLPNRRINSILVDLYSPELTYEWQKFLAKCTLNNIPIYNISQLEEALTGRVKIKHMYENNLGSLLPSPTYLLIKRIIDIVLILITSPITLPIMAITAIAIPLESKGGILFIQNRVGQGGKEFKIYKFRSMCKDSEKDGAKFAAESDTRVTRIGKFIRKTRIDELPQFFNVLKGDMSLIGPRPEQKAFVDKFEDTIPFYSYRHIVKPGISGWAQVVQGYATDADDTQIKTEHDFYYIKHFSLSLDILIIFKTLKTMLTGFGAR